MTGSNKNAGDISVPKKTSFTGTSIAISLEVKAGLIIKSEVFLVF